MLKLCRKLAMAGKSIAAIMGQSGIFVRPTATPFTFGSAPFSVTNAANIVDTDNATYGVIECHSDNGNWSANVAAQFTFAGNQIHPGGKLRIKHKITMDTYSPGQMQILYSSATNASNPKVLATYGIGTNHANPIISEFNITEPIGCIIITGVGGSKYSWCNDNVFDIALEL